MKKKIVIFGGGSHAKVIFHQIIENKKYLFIGFIDDRKKKGELIYNFKKKNYYNLNSIEDLNLKGKKLKSNKVLNNITGIIGVGLNYLRKKIYDDITKSKKKIIWEVIKSNTSIISKDVKLGEGSLIMPGVVINPGTVIGKHCIVNTSSSIDHDNYFEDFSSCGPGVITGGNVNLGELSHIGIGAVVKNNIKIGQNTVVGGNSFVNKNCVNNHFFYGTPIKKVKKKLVTDNYLK
jgi:sugar O-acyltransferase (sialic acid O-acetyltransferase NeuD family)